ncbi:MAG: BLUF domain-containing protein [Methylotenera sp.]
MLLDDDLSLLAYTSVACHHMSHQELITLLTHCRQKNSSRNISGMLLYMDGCFFQVLEGPRAQLELLFEKISKDQRHHHVMKLIVEPITERAFENWSMGFKDITAAELASITGLTNFLNNEEKGFMGIESTRAKQLIQTFRDGRWLRKDLTQYRIINMIT